MFEFIEGKNPEFSFCRNEAKCTVCVAGAAFPERILSELEKRFRLFVLPPDPDLPDSVSGHADLCLFRIGEALFCHRPYFDRNGALINEIAETAGLKIVCSASAAGSAYPDDCGLCIRAADCEARYIIYNPQVSDTTAVDEALRGGFKPVRVRQGYCACSAAVCADGAVITSDRGIAAALASSGIDCLTISPGSIELPGVGKSGTDGFIGGASGLCGSTLVFAGAPTTHPDYPNIAEFCARHGTAIGSVGSGRLYDGGGLLFF